MANDLLKTNGLSARKGISKLEWVAMRKGVSYLKNLNSSTGLFVPAVSSNGTLVYREGANVNSSQLIWFTVVVNWAAGLKK